jgi:Bax protein
MPKRLEMLKRGYQLDRRKIRELVAAGVTTVGLLILILIVSLYGPANRPASVSTPEPTAVFPDFASILDTDIRKKQFFDFFQEHIYAENAHITETRRELLAYAEIFGADATLTDHERERLLDLAASYKVDTDISSDKLILQELLLRVDVIPTSLVLAQAANESGWGTSRFALEGNNIFGQWCYQLGCGIVPHRRANGAKHEVKRFDSIEAAIESYFRNINTHHLYSDFREKRAQYRMLGWTLDSTELVQELGRYSQRGESYIDELQTMIRQNKLRQRDRRWAQR